MNLNTWTVGNNWQQVDQYDHTQTGRGVKITAQEAVTNTGAAPWVPESDEVAPLTFKDPGGPAIPGWVEQYQVMDVATLSLVEETMNRMAIAGWEYQQVIRHSAGYIIIFSRETYAC